MCETYISDIKNTKGFPGPDRLGLDQQELATSAHGTRLHRPPHATWTQQSPVDLSARLTDLTGDTLRLG